MAQSKKSRDKKKRRREARETRKARQAMELPVRRTTALSPAHPQDLPVKAPAVKAPPVEAAQTPLSYNASSEDSPSHDLSPHDPPSYDPFSQDPFVDAPNIQAHPVQAPPSQDPPSQAPPIQAPPSQPPPSQGPHVFLHNPFQAFSLSAPPPNPDAIPAYDVPYIKTTVLILADTHPLRPCDVETLVRSLPPQKPDLAIHCGGLTAISDMHGYRAAARLLDAIPAPLKIVIPGRSDHTLYADWDEVHAAWFARARDVIGEVDRVVLHNDRRAETRGAGATHEVRLPNGAYLRYFVAPFAPPPHEDSRFWIEEETDIAVTALPPYGILDRDARGRNVGSPELLGHIAVAKPRVHCFGQAGASCGWRVGTWLDDEVGDGGELAVETPLHSGEARRVGRDGREKEKTLFVNGSMGAAEWLVHQPYYLVEMLLPARRPTGWRGTADYYVPGEVDVRPEVDSRGADFHGGGGEDVGRRVRPYNPGREARVEEWFRQQPDELFPGY